jgi:hypothetical protein
MSRLFAFICVLILLTAPAAAQSGYKMPPADVAALVDKLKNEAKVI